MNAGGMKTVGKVKSVTLEPVSMLVSSLNVHPMQPVQPLCMIQFVLAFQAILEMAKLHVH